MWLIVSNLLPRNIHLLILLLLTWIHTTTCKLLFIGLLETIELCASKIFLSYWNIFFKPYCCILTFDSAVSKGFLHRMHLFITGIQSMHGCKPITRITNRKECIGVMKWYVHRYPWSLDQSVNQKRFGKVKRFGERSARARSRERAGCSRLKPPIKEANT